MREQFLNPFTTIEKVIDRQKVMNFLCNELSDWKMPYTEKMIENVEKYLKSNIVISKFKNKFRSFLDSLSFGSTNLE